MNRDKEIAWSAGLLEGEGCFSTRYKGKTPRIECEMTDEDVLLRLQSIFGGSIAKYKARKDNWKATYKWLAYSNLAASIMEEVLPYMGKRRTERIVTILSEWEEFKKQQNSKLEARIAAAKDYLESGDSLRTVAKRHNTSYEGVRRALGLVAQPG